MHWAIGIANFGKIAGGYHIIFMPHFSSGLGKAISCTDACCKYGNSGKAFNH